MKPLISIIIPTYNRGHLISETLDSIIGQIFTSWECIVIDDGSEDNTNDILNSYCKRDTRIQYFYRPSNRPKGANTCRNYGFELSKGEYIKWFDSDDIMLPEHLSKVFKVIHSNNTDFVVSKSINFEIGKEVNTSAYEFDIENAKIDAFKFAKYEIGWITDDFFCKRSLVSNFRFNEELEDGQEYNFFIQILLNNTNGVFINEILTKMRIHSQSLGVINRKDQLNYIYIVAKIKILTLDNVFKKKHILLNDWFLSGYINIAFNLVLKKKMPPKILKGLFYVFQIKGFVKTFFFILSLVTASFFNKGYKLNKYARN